MPRLVCDVVMKSISCISLIVSCTSSGTMSYKVFDAVVCSCFIYVYIVIRLTFYITRVPMPMCGFVLFYVIVNEETYLTFNSLFH